MRLRHTLKLALDQWRNHSAILRQFVLPPTNRQIAPKRLAVIKINADDRSFQIKTLLHGSEGTVPEPLDVSAGGAVPPNGSRHTKVRWKSMLARHKRRKSQPPMPHGSN